MTQLEKEIFAAVNRSFAESKPHPLTNVSLLTGGGDRPYALGLATALGSAGISIDFIGSDELKAPAVLDHPRVNFLNLRGDQSPEAPIWRKIARVPRYYWRLARYAATASPTLFHLLWNNKFELLDRTVLMFYYRLLGKKVVLTVHNVNIRQRDSNDSWLNRFSLRIHYSLSDHIFAHTERMKDELVANFGIPPDKISVIPFGINNTIPNTNLSSAEAKRRLGVESNDKAQIPILSREQRVWKVLKLCSSPAKDR